MIKFIKYIVSTTELGFDFLCLVFSKGFFFYFYLLASILEKIIPTSFFKKLKVFFKEKQNDTTAFLFLILLFLVGVLIHTYYYSEIDVKHVNDNNSISTKNNNDTNLYRRYGSYKASFSSLEKVKKNNKNVILWLVVDGTNVNYPVVQTKDNDYYLNHDITGDLKSSGWVFMDYRNDKLNDDNTIIYGHNLPNKTSFGSLNNLFTKKWYNSSNHYIEVLYDNNKYTYEVFSVYEIKPEVYYLQNNFYKKEYEEFLNTIKSRSIYDFNVDLTTDDKIITLSTCTSDNKGRKVIHAKRIK